MVNGNIAVVAVIMCSSLYLCIGCSAKYSVWSCGTMLALTVCILAFDPCQNVKVLVLLCYWFDSSLVARLSTLVATALLDTVLTWRHHHHTASTSSCAHQHAVAALTFSTIIRLLLINSLPCSVCFISKASHPLPPGSLQQQQQQKQQCRETRSHSLN